MTHRTFAALLAVGFAACSSSDTVPPAGAVTEHDLSADPSLAIGPGQVGVTFLEPSDGGSTLPDTGAVGVDELAFEQAEATTFTLGLDPEDGSGTIARAVLTDPAGAVLATLTPAAPSVTLTLPAGRYVVAIHAAYGVADAGGADHRTVFLRPRGVPSSPSSAASAPDAGRTAVNANLVQQLLTTGSCPGCDLSGANLARANLAGAKLMSANLSRVMALKTILTGAKLMSANLTGAYLEQANLCGADATGAILKGTMLAHATWVDCRACSGASIDACK